MDCGNRIRQFPSIRGVGWFIRLEIGIELKSAIQESKDKRSVPSQLQNVNAEIL